jgi:hypothetical protein
MIQNTAQIHNICPDIVLQGSLNQFRLSFLGESNNLVETSAVFREIFSQTEKYLGKYAERSTEDPGDFLLALTDKLPYANSQTRRKITQTWKVSENDADVITTETLDANSSVVFTIYQNSHQDFAESLFVTTQVCLSNEEKLKGYTQAWETTTIVETPYLVIYRPYQFASSIKANETLVIGEQTLRLHAVVTYNGFHHYICYFRWKNVWYFYNDIGHKKGRHTTQSRLLAVVGSSDDLWSLRDLNPQQFGVLFFYSVDL